MAKKQFGPGNGKSQPQGRSSEEQELAQIRALPTWNREQAAQVLLDQRSSGLGIAQYAEQRGVSAGRLYNWKTKLKAVAGPQDRAGTSPGGTENLVSVQDARLDLSDPGERHAHQYVQRAIRGEDRMWCLLAIGRQGAQLLCVVRWVKQTRNPKPYSLVALELTEPALRWHDYASVDEAQEAMEQRMQSAPACPGEGMGPALVRVQVRSQAAPSPVELPRQPAVSAPSSCITVWLPSGVHIRIPQEVPEAQLRAVLETIGAPSC